MILIPTNKQQNRRFFSQLVDFSQNFLLLTHPVTKNETLKSDIVISAEFTPNSNNGTMLTNEIAIDNQT